MQRISARAILEGAEAKGRLEGKAEGEALGLEKGKTEANIETALLQVVLLAENLFAKAYSEGTLAPAGSCPDKTRPKR